MQVYTRRYLHLPVDIYSPGSSQATTRSSNPSCRTTTPLIIQNPAKHLDHAKKEVVAARYFDIPATAIERAAIKGMA